MIARGEISKVPAPRPCRVRRLLLTLPLAASVVAGCTAGSSTLRGHPSAATPHPAPSRTAASRSAAGSPSPTAAPEAQSAAVDRLTTSWVLPSATTADAAYAIPDSPDKSRFTTDGASVYDINDNAARTAVRRSGANGKQVWSTPTPGKDVCATPLVTQGVLLTCTETDLDYNGDILAAYALDSGRLLWRHGGVTLPTGKLVVAGGRIVTWAGAGTDSDAPHNGRLVALDPRTGATRARLALAHPLIDLVGDGSRAYAYSAAGISAYSPALKRVWTHSVEVNVNNRLTAFGSGVVLNTDGAHDTEVLTRYDRAGHVLWHRSTTDSLSQVQPVGSSSFLLESGTSSLIVNDVDATTGKTRWEHLLVGTEVVAYSAEILGPVMYLCDGRLLALDARSGALETAAGTSPQDLMCGDNLGSVGDSVVVQDATGITALQPQSTGARQSADEWAAPEAQNCPFPADRAEAALHELTTGTWTLSSSSPAPPYCEYRQLNNPGLSASISADGSGSGSPAQQLIALSKAGFPSGCFPSDNVVTALSGFPSGTFVCTGSYVGKVPGFAETYDGFAGTSIGSRVVTVSYDPAPSVTSRSAIVPRLRAALAALRS